MSDSSDAQRRTFMDIIDSRGARALWRTSAFLLLLLISVLSFLGTSILGDIRDLRSLVAQTNVELAKITGATALTAAVVTNHEVRIIKLEDWRLSRPFREP